MKLTLRKYFNGHGDWVNVERVENKGPLYVWYNTNNFEVEGGRKITRYKFEKMMEKYGFKRYLEHCRRPVRRRSLKKGIKARVKKIEA